MASLQFPPGQVAGPAAEFCPGYSDILGVWNPGFFCQTGTQDLYCCGGERWRYCCSLRDQQAGSAGQGGADLVAALAVASTSFVLLATIISCICCPYCPNYDKRAVQSRGPSRPPVLLAEPGRQRQPGRAGGPGSRAGSRSSVSCGEVGPGPGLAERDRREQQYEEFRQMSHSHTLPHSLSHHTSK